MHLILIRHGETHANVLYETEDRILIGALDSPLTQLTEKGRAQAAETGELLKGIQVDEIYSSDLGRTKETAALVFPQRTIHFTPLLRERSLGSDEGKRTKELFQDESIWLTHVNSETDSVEERLSKRVPDGENYLMVMERCRTFLSQFDFSEDKTIALVAHFHLIRCMIYVLTEHPQDLSMFDIAVPNAKPLFFSYENSTFVQEFPDLPLKKNIIS